MTYKIPDINRIMTAVPHQEQSQTEEELLKQGNLLIFLLDNFNVHANLKNILAGPIVTRYELTLEAGVKSKAITELSTDLAMGLKAKSIRIVPLPEKSVISVEIPNTKPHIVYIRDIMNSPEFSNDKDSITLILGKDVSGKPVTTDLTQAPHMIVAGQTGSGKSVGINAMLASMLANKTPDELRLILIDPKIVELSPYNDVPHLLTPVITQPRDSVRILEWVVKEMEDRYEKLAAIGVRNIKGYKKPGNQMPFIVVVIDEMADLMMTAGKMIEKYIVRIAQKARAVGIHLILTTQRPSVNVITGIIKANVPTRIGFQTSCNIDSRTIMDKGGCETLLGNGDMLFNEVTSPELKRIHGAYIDYADVDAIIKECNQVKPKHINFNDDITIKIHGVAKVSEKLMKTANDLINAGGNTSTAYIQRKMNVDYNIANSIVKELKRNAA